MPDTPDLQQAFPQPSNQAPGCGFPVARIVTLFCWSTGAIIDLAIGSLRVHELTLWRQLWHHLRSGDVVLGDRSFGSYVDIARLRWRRVHGVFRLHASRKADFRKGDRLGKDDQLVVWQRPAHWTPSCGLTREEFTHVPNEMVVRQIRISDAPKGFRSRTIVVVTTLLDPVEAPADEIRALYRDRWTVELDLRSLKIALGMDVLRAHTVDVVGKELMMHLVAYNLIRVLMWQAAKRHDRDLHSLSFTGTLHRLQAAASQLLLLDRLISKDTAFDYLLQRIAEDVLPDRPGRTEPRCVKRRPKNCRRLTRPRRPSRAVKERLTTDHGINVTRTQLLDDQRFDTDSQARIDGRGTMLWQVNYGAAYEHLLSMLRADVSQVYSLPACRCLRSVRPTVWRSAAAA